MISTEKAPAMTILSWQEDLARLSKRQKRKVLSTMSTEKVRELATLPNGRQYRSWTNGLFMTDAERIARGAAKHEIRQRKRLATLLLRDSQPQKKWFTLRFYAVSTRGGGVHIMRSSSPRVESVIGQLLMPNAKNTLCGQPVIRSMADLFAPDEASCRECKRRMASLR